MGPTTEIHEVTLCVGGDWLSIGESLNQLDLIVLSTGCEKIYRILF